jgi:adenylate cyclase
MAASPACSNCGASIERAKGNEQAFTSVYPAGVSELFDWLVDGAQGCATPPEIVEQCGERLRAQGIPADRVAAFVMTLHPDVAGRSFTWTAGKEVTIAELSYAAMRSPMFEHSPIGVLYRAPREIRARLAQAAAPREYAVYDELAAAGYTDYVALPMRFTSGEIHAMAYATKEPGGFTDEQVDELRRITRPLSRVAEIFALRRTATNLLSTYVGRNAGDRVLRGRIRRGDLEVIDAVIWFSDLRGFTELSQRVPAREVIDALNAAFECQVDAVHAHGGEVLKFIGDGMLAIFPLAGGEVAARCSDAIAAAHAAQSAFAVLRADLAFGIALHVGEVSYGNIGGKNRLDFTAIGPAVNLTARLEGLTGKLGRPLVVSQQLAAHAHSAVESVGTFELKGIAGAVEVFAPRR